MSFETVKERFQRFPLHLLIIFLILAIGIGVSGYLYYVHQKKDLKKQVEYNLSSIADLKAGQIVNWRKERLGDAETIYSSHLITHYIEQWLKNGSPGIKKEIFIWMRSFQETYQYRSISLIDLKGNIRLTVPEGREMLDRNAKELVKEAIGKKKIIFSDLYRNKDTDHIHLALIVPLLVDRGQNTAVIGTLLLGIDPYQFLYPLIQTWPTRSETAETVLFRRDGNDIVFLSDTRDKKNAALNLRFSTNEPRLPAAMAMRGIRGTVEGIDYQGVHILAAVKPIPDSPWYLTAKINKEEIYAPLRERLWLITIFVFGLIAAAGAGIVLIWSKQTTESLKELTEALEQRVTDRTAELRKLTEELERSNTDLQQFAYAASHDLKEPLRGIAGFARLLEKRYKGKLDKKADEFIDFIISDANRMHQLITDLLEYSRIAAASQTVNPINCSAVLEEAFSNLHSLVEETGTELTYDTLPTVMVNASQLKCLFQNLLGNAIKFHSQEKPRIHVSCERQENEWVFSVRDNGIGFESGLAERIFLVFQRLHSRQQYPGTGIGLALCKKIVERHGGRIWAESEPGKGSTFFFTLPQREANA